MSCESDSATEPATLLPGSAIPVESSFDDDVWALSPSAVKILEWPVSASLKDMGGALIPCKRYALKI